MEILLNGGTAKDFFPSRGAIRLGDPLSLYIFTFCMEYLSNMINQARVLR